MHMIRPLSAALLMSLALMGAGCAQPTTTMPMTSTLSARLAGSSEVPAVNSAGSGTLDATLNKQTMVLSYTVTYTGLSGAATAGHLHGPAPAGTNAGVALPFSGNLASPFKGQATLTADQMSQLMAGNWYVNLHTAANPGGEIRGQVNMGK